MVIGSGIAGPLAALALHTGDTRAAIYDAGSTAPAPGWLAIHASGLAALRALDLEAAAIARGFLLPALELHAATGKHLGTLSRPAPALAIQRADLHALLAAEARRRGIPVTHARRFVTLDAASPAATGVVAVFADGSEAAADLVVGADGVHSRVRRVIDPHAPLPRALGLALVGGATTAGDLPPGVHHLYLGRRATLEVAVSPTGTAWWSASVPAVAAPNPAAWRAHLLAQFPEPGAPRALIDGTAVLAAALQYDLVDVPVWSRGPLVVIGDAAHAAAPTSGHGAAIAAGDAIELARCLADASPLATGLAAFERIRRAAVERLVDPTRTTAHRGAGPLGRLVLPWLLRRQARDEAA